MNAAMSAHAFVAISGAFDKSSDDFSTLTPIPMGETINFPSSGKVTSSNSAIYSNLWSFFSFFLLNLKNAQGKNARQFEFVLVCGWLNGKTMDKFASVLALLPIINISPPSIACLYWPPEHMCVFLIFSFRKKETTTWMGKNVQAWHDALEN